MTLARAGTATVCMLLLAFVLDGCGGSSASKTQPTTAPGESTAGGATLSTPGTTTSPRTSAVSPSTKPQPGVLVIHIRSFAYLPPAPVVLVGQRIEIINDDAVAHTWSAAPKSNWSYTSGNLERGQRATFAGFTKPGRYPFVCYYHAEMPSMTGTVTVKAS